MNTAFVKECIKRIEKSYNTKVLIRPAIIEEINIMYPISSGCWFMDWLNHRLYPEIMMISTLNELEEPPPFIDSEELCNDVSDTVSDTDDDDEEKKDDDDFV